MVKVSVIVPVYNVEEYLERCLDSITNQSLRDIEIICVNDGSTDGSREILEGYKKRDSRVVVIDSGGNYGQAHARNCGLDVAKGKYIYFVDADDMVKDGALEFLYDSMRREILDGMLFGAECISALGYESSMGDFQKSKTGGLTCSGIDMLARLIENDEYTSTVWTQFWSRKYLEEKKIRFRDDTSPHEDILFSIRAIFMAERMQCTDRRLYTYRKRPGSTTTTPMTKKKTNAILISYIEVMKFLERQMNIPHDVIRALGKWSTRYRSLVQNCIRDLAFQGIAVYNMPFVNEEHFRFFHYYIQDEITCNAETFSDDVMKGIQSAKYIIVYGAGKIGEKWISWLIKKKVYNFFVAQTKKKNGIYSIYELQRYSSESFVFLATGRKNHKDMVACLEELGFRNYISVT